MQEPTGNQWLSRPEAFVITQEIFLMQGVLSHLLAASSRGVLPGLVWALSSDAAGAARELPAGAPIESMADGWIWLHFSLAENGAINLLDDLPGLPRQAAMLLKERGEIPQIHSEGAFTYGSIGDLQRVIGAAGEDLGVLHFIMSDKVLITGRRSPLNAAGVTRERILNGLRITAVEDLLAVIVEQVVDGVDVHIEKISREVDDLEDRIVSGSISGARSRLAMHRRTTIRLRRHISELRLLFQRIEREGKRAANPAGIARITGELLQESEALDRDAAALSDRTRQLHEEIATLLTEETNKHLRVLSVLSILFLPPTFIAGLFGMNLRGMLFGSHELGFWSATALAVVSSAAVLAILRRAGVLSA
jgi:zinc transporter